MKKAIFCDFYGTLVHENGPISLEVVGRVAESCGAAPEDVVAFWWERFGALSARCCGVDFRTRYDIAVESFQETVERFGSPEDPRALTDRMVEHWCAPPLYEDARAFLEAAPAPVYLVTNSDDHFVEEALRRYGLPVAGAVTSQAARYAKPRPEIFRFALERYGLRPGETVHLGDSLAGDVETPRALGIRAFLEAAPAPVYLVTNSDDHFVEEALRRYGLPVAGAVTSQAARYAKPRPEIFRFALERYGLRPGETVHLGDSLAGDVETPRALGIRALWLNRKGKPVPPGVEAAENLAEAARTLAPLF